MDEAIIEDGYVEVDFTILFCACLKFFILKYLDIQEERVCVGTYQKNMVSSLHKCHFPPLRERSLSRQAAGTIKSLVPKSNLVGIGITQKGQEGAFSFKGEDTAEVSS